MTDVIKTINLSKHYGQLHAVENISLSVRQGEIYGFLGLNGAGKTTAIRMLLGMIRPTSGAAYLNGKKVDAGNCNIWNNIGYIVEIPYSYPELTVKENLEIIRKLRGITAKDAISKIINKLQLDSYTNIQAKHLSLGNAQRLGLAKALMHNPSILILDEPANGLDPAGIVEIRDLLHDLALNQGVTIFVSSHILGEISRIALRVGIIHNGILIQEVDASQLKSLQKKRLILNTRNNKSAISILANAGYNVNVMVDGSMEILDSNAISLPEEIARILVYAECPPTQLKVEEEELEAYFLRTISQIGGKAQ